MSSNLTQPSCWAEAGRNGGPYSVDLRSRARARKAAGETHRQITAALRISASCLSKWARHERETGSLAPARTGGHKPRTLSGECAQ
ncbi:hypothetical protein [Caulobacter sp. S45]|uniref:hypothetical protein n=1 Tax=Caulobacter sp. S45 TaxID=1641861 RepID=UPI0015765813